MRRRFKEPSLVLKFLFTKKEIQIRHSSVQKSLTKQSDSNFSCYALFAIKDRNALLVNLVLVRYGPTNSLVCNRTLIQMSHIKTLKITPTCFDHQLIIIRELLILVKITG
jgi:hypothetical protein